MPHIPLQTTRAHSAASPFLPHIVISLGSPSISQSHRSFILARLDIDAAVLGRPFRHLHRKEQINSFLSAVQGIRQPRVEQVVKASLGAVSLPPGVAGAHDRALRGRAEKNIKDLARRRSYTSEQMVQVIQSIFVYDPEDEADNWWIQWGFMQERAAHWTVYSDQPLALGG